MNQDVLLTYTGSPLTYVAGIDPETQNSQWFVIVCQGCHSAVTFPNSDTYYVRRILRAGSYGPDLTGRSIWHGFTQRVFVRACDMVEPHFPAVGG
jgi:hypothetical protein